jgi:hypothetical protein
MVTLGLRTFIINPLLKSERSDLSGTVLLLRDIFPSAEKTLKARKNRYIAPKILIARKKLSDSLIIAETPKATRLVWIKIPETSPRVVKIPAFLPLAILCTSTYIISGPGEIVRITEAVRKGISWLITFYPPGLVWPY